MFCDECGFKNKETAKFCKKCGASLADEKEELTKENIEEVLEKDFENSQDEMKLTKKQLLEYLNLGKELEINKLGLENGIKDLHKLDKQKYNEIVRPLQNVSKPKFDPSVETETITGIAGLVAIPLFFVALFTYRKLYPSFYSKFFAWDFPDLFAAAIITVIIGVVLFMILLLIKLILHNTIGRQKYSREVARKAKQNADINKTNKLQLEKYNDQKAIITGRVESIDKDLKDVEKTLNKYYDVDVIYPKYRNLIAITTFIEYLESGRCKSLYGYTGCYNVYEQELRQNTIIGKLDQVLIQLDQIKKMQFATYVAIQQSNAIQSAMLDTCNAMLVESQRESALLEAQAQDNKIIKRNSEIVTTISELNYIKHN